MKKVLTFDFGASGGRAIVSWLENGEIVQTEVCRFANTPIYSDGSLVWDIDKLQQHFLAAIKTATVQHRIASIGCDTWGVDFGLLDDNGSLLGLPVTYRDKRTEGIPDEVYKIIPKEQLFCRSGIQPYPYNTIFQLYYLATRQPQLLQKANKLLTMANLFMFPLTGRYEIEQSMASTTGLTDITGASWDYELIDLLKLPRHIFPDIVPSGTIRTIILPAYKDIAAVNIATHDTASAVMAAQKDAAFISCGTWSLLGRRIVRPIVTNEAYSCGYSNERGYKGETVFLKNLTGLWIIQQLAKEWDIPIQAIMRLAQESDNQNIYIDTDDKAFFAPASMSDAIDSYLHTTITDKGKKARLVYYSLAKKYAEEINNLDKITGIRTDTINIVGGGSRADLLVNLTAELTGCKIIAGPAEATAIGGAMAQLHALGELPY